MVIELCIYLCSSVLNRSICKMLSEKVPTRHSTLFVNCPYKKMALPWCPRDLAHIHIGHADKGLKGSQCAEHSVILLEHRRREVCEKL